MAVVTRYFAPSAAGTGDGTTLANAAALFVAGAWSSVITGFNFSGADALKCQVTPGAYTNGSSLLASSFANPPTVANPLILQGADASGNDLAVPQSGWTSDQPEFDTSSYPVLTTSTAIVNGVSAIYRMLKFFSSTRNGVMVNGGIVDWCAGEVSTAGVGVIVFASQTRLTNSWAKCSGAWYSACVQALVSTAQLDNVRLVGNAAATSGTRAGLISSPSSAATGSYSRLCALNHPGYGLNLATTSTAENLLITKCTVVNCPIGVAFNATAGQTALNALQDTIVTGATTTAVDCGNGLVSVNNVRLRNGTTIANAANVSANGVYTAAGTDASDYHNPTGGDYRVADATVAGKGIGVSAYVAAGGSSGGVSRARAFGGAL